jgi:hypothetical protein
MAGFPAPSVSPVVRQGNKLIIPAPAPRQPAILPPPCIKCGAPADGKPVERVFYWHNPALYLVLLAGLVVYAIVALIVRKSIRVRIPLCAHHAKRRSTGITIGLVLMVAGIADIFILNRFDVDGGIIALVTFVLILTGIIVMAVVASTIRPRFIDQFRGEFIGFSPAYLQNIREGGMPAAPVMVTGQAPPPPIAP